MNEETKAKVKQIAEMVEIYKEQMFNAGAENFDLIKIDLENKKIQLQEIVGQWKSDLNKLYDDGANEIDPEVNGLQGEIQKVENSIDDINQLLTASVEDIDKAETSGLIEEIDKLEPETEHAENNPAIEGTDEEIEKTDNLDSEDIFFEDLTKSIEALPDEEENDSIDPFDIDPLDKEEILIEERLNSAQELNEELGDHKNEEESGDHKNEEEPEFDDDFTELDDLQENEYDENANDNEEIESEYEEAHEYDIEIPAVPEIPEYEPSDEYVEQKYQYADVEVEPADENMDELVEDIQEDEKTLEQNDEDGLEDNGWVEKIEQLNGEIEQYQEEKNNQQSPESVEEIRETLEKEDLVEFPKQHIDDFRTPTQEIINLAGETVESRIAEDVRAIMSGFKTKYSVMNELKKTLGENTIEQAKVTEPQYVVQPDDKTLDDRIR